MASQTVTISEYEQQCQLFIAQIIETPTFSLTLFQLREEVIGLETACTGITNKARFAPLINLISWLGDPWAVTASGLYANILHAQKSEKYDTVGFVVKEGTGDCLEAKEELPAKLESMFKVKNNAMLLKSQLEVDMSPKPVKPSRLLQAQARLKINSATSYVTVTKPPPSYCHNSVELQKALKAVLDEYSVNYEIVVKYVYQIFNDWRQEYGSQLMAQARIDVGQKVMLMLPFMAENGLVRENILYATLVDKKALEKMESDWENLLVAKQTGTITF